MRRTPSTVMVREIERTAGFRDDTERAGFLGWLAGLAEQRGLAV